jgi:hypothetical protein
MFGSKRQKATGNKGDNCRRTSFMINHGLRKKIYVYRPQDLIEKPKEKRPNEICDSLAANTTNIS